MHEKDSPLDRGVSSRESGRNVMSSRLLIVVCSTPSCRSKTLDFTNRKLSFRRLFYASSNSICICIHAKTILNDTYNLIYGRPAEPDSDIYIFILRFLLYGRPM